jgi:hypothetical protein
MNKGTTILGIWASITALILVLILQIGMEFMGIMILLGFAALMTVVILEYDKRSDGEDLDEVEELRSSVKSLEEKIEELKKLLEE